MEVTANAPNTNSNAVAVESSEMMVSFRFRLERSKFGIAIPAVGTAAWTCTTRILRAGKSPQEKNIRGRGVRGFA
ncbi:hypothetical protein GCM10009094_08000 [Massilia aurea]